MKQGIAALRDDLGAERTLGQYLFDKQEKDEKAILRFRPSSTGSGNSWEIYPERTMFEHEIRRIFAQQSKYYDDLNEALLERILRIVIDQRPLRKPKVGSCRFFVEDSRAPLALPSQQRFRILQEVSNLEIRQGLAFRKPSGEEREEIIRQLLLTASTRCTNKAVTELTFAKIRSKIIGDSSVHFNLEELGR